MPLVSVIIPTRDRPRYLPEAIASVLHQDFGDFELIVVNDGEALAPLPPDRRIRHLENARRGAVAARNLGVDNARGGIIAFLDDDDRWVDHSYLATASGLVSAGADFVYGDGLMQFPNEPSPRGFSRSATAASLARDNTILVSAVSYRRALHESLGGFDPALPYYWDWDWYLRVARCGAVLAHIERPVVDIRIHGQNMSGGTQRAARQGNLDTLAQKHGLGELTLKNHTDFV